MLYCNLIRVREGTVNKKIKAGGIALVDEFASYFDSCLLSWRILFERLRTLQRNLIFEYMFMSITTIEPMKFTRTMPITTHPKIFFPFGESNRGVNPKVSIDTANTASSLNISITCSCLSIKGLK